MKQWTVEEIQLLKNNLAHGTKQIFDVYQDTFGSARSYDSVQKRVKKLRDAYSVEDELSTNIDINHRLIMDYDTEMPEQNWLAQELFIPSPVSYTFRKQGKEDSRQWLRDRRLHERFRFGKRKYVFNQNG